MTVRATSAYVICATPRSGSTLLCDLMETSGVAGHPHSYFDDIAYWAELWGVRTPISDPSFDRAYLAAMKQTGTAATDVFGLRLMWRSVGEATARLAKACANDRDLPTNFAQLFGPTLFIHLSRQDKLAQAVSLVRAEQTGLWHVAPDGSERERTAPGAAPSFDAARIAGTRAMLEEQDQHWHDLFAAHAIEPLRLTYEHVAADPRATLAALLNRLGRTPASGGTATVGTAKLADATSADWLDRMRAVPATAELTSFRAGHTPNHQRGAL